MTRIVKDSMGELEVADEALYGAQTQRALNNFPISGLRMPNNFIKSLAMIKAAAAKSNAKLKLIDKDIAESIYTVAMGIANGDHLQHFPVDVFQTGSGTSSNMNANEVIATLASKILNINIHPNDHVNIGQSSNDIIPSTIHLSCCTTITNELLPALEKLSTCIKRKADSLKDIVKTGRTHLMDATPIRFSQELSGWQKQIDNNVMRVKNNLMELQTLAIGGTAVGTGLNSHPKFPNLICKELSSITKLSFSPRENYFEALSSQDAIVNMSGSLRVLAISLIKIANDLRLMNSGPLTGVAEIILPAIQPGSSIMPGKINPVIPEAVCMLCAQVIGNDTTIAYGGSSGNFQLNVMLPVIAYNILQSIDILSNGCGVFASCIDGFIVNEDKIKQQLDVNPILVTALNATIGYEKGAQIAKKAYSEKRSILEVAKEMTDLSYDELKSLLNPLNLT